MPASGIRDELPSRADWERLGQLKRTWEVSIAALLKRAQTLGTMSDTAYTQAMKTMSARGWRKREPVDLGPPERPVLLPRALEVAAAHGVTLEALAAENGLPLHDVRKILQHFLDPRPTVEL
jgi:Zn-dependent peptidase ImmA (M78 family)